MPSNETEDKIKTPEKNGVFYGYTGTSITGGRFDEEYLINWDRETSLDSYDKMRRSDSQVKMVLSAVKNPIKSAKFNHVPQDNDEQSKQIAEFLDWNWFDNPLFDFEQWMTELLTYLDFGFCIHEKKFATYDHKEYGLVHILADMGFRKQQTIWEWDVKGKKGLQGVRQIAYGDTVDDQTSGDVYIPIEKLCMFVNEREGDNWEGIALLRPCYGPWFRKNIYLKLNSIGIEKAAIGTPVGTYPRGAENEEDKAAFKTALQNFALHESSYMMIPELYKVEIIKIQFDSEKVMAGVKYEDIQMAKSILFQFLELGTNSSSGSFSLGSDMSDFALSALQFVGDGICKKMDEINQKLVEWNFGEVEWVPRAKCSGINQKSGEELSTVIKNFTDAAVIRPDDRLEAEVRERYHLPAFETTREQDAEKIRSEQEKLDAEVDSESTENDEPIPKPSEKPDDKKEFAETYRRQLTEYEKPLKLAELEQAYESEAQKLHRLMKMNLTKMSDRALRGVESLLKRNKKDKTKAALEFEINSKAYENDLKRQYGHTVTVGAKSAKRDMTVKLSEYQFADDVLQFLSPHVKSALLLQSKYQAEAHKQDIEQIVTLGIMNGVEADQDDAQLISGINHDLNEYVESGLIKNAATIAVSQNMARGRDGFFFDQENLKQIQAFQYSAVLDGRTTDICLSLDGQIMLPTDKDLPGLRPPNHFNCRSILVPITVNEPKPEVTGIAIDPNNPALIQDYKDKGKSKPNLTKIQKSRNL